MIKSRSLVLFLALVTLSACAERWEKPGATEQDLDAAKSSCFTRASAQFPPLVRLVPVTDGYTTPVTTNCSSGRNSTSCTTSGGQYVPPTMGQVDDNQKARDQAVRACLFEHGWHIAKDN